MNEIAVLTFPFLDRARGYPWNVRGLSMLWKVLYGYAMAVALGHFSGEATLLITVGMVVGMSFKWSKHVGGAILQPDDESHQWGLVRRGAVWGACVLLTAVHFEPRVSWLPLIYAAAMPLAVYTAHWTGARGDDAWARQEWLRGLLVGVAVLAVLLFL
jgi:hypothetical protein